jgi:hypothetical protein
MSLRIWPEVSGLLDLWSILVKLIASRRAGIYFYFYGVNLRCGLPPASGTEIILESLYPLDTSQVKFFLDDSVRRVLVGGIYLSSSIRWILFCLLINTRIQGILAVRSIDTSVI